MHDSIIAPLVNLLHNAPSLILLGCAALFVVFLVYSGLIWRASHYVRQSLRSLTVALDGLHGNEEGESKNGLSLERKDAYFVVCENLKGLPREWWARLAQRIELYKSPEDRDGWFLTENPRTVLPYEVVVGRNFHAANFSAFPGILTGSGLTLTFTHYAVLGITNIFTPFPAERFFNLSTKARVRTSSVLTPMPH